MEQIINVDISFVSLSKGKVTAVDTKYFNRLLEDKWCTLEVKLKNKIKYYARRTKTVILPNGNKKRVTELMHRKIIEFQLEERGLYGELEKFRNNPRFWQVDHKNDDTLLNTEANLHKCTARENMMNLNISQSCDLPGVYICRGRAVSRIMHNGKSEYIVSYKDSPENRVKAHEAYMEKCKELSGAVA